jgi:glutathione synthase
MVDQRLLENELWSVHAIKAVFMTMAEVAELGRLDEDSRLLIRRPSRVGDLPGEEEEYRISVAYFRAGYTPDDYYTEAEWSARGMIEASCAVKCPTLGYQLAGTKKVQQALCVPGVLERYLSPGECATVRRCFAGQYSLGALATPESEAAIEVAIRDGRQWVLKPQREGGGNNLYGSELSAFLSSHKNDPILSGTNALFASVLTIDSLTVDSSIH